jgi:hypothetical protein
MTDARARLTALWALLVLIPGSGAVSCADCAGGAVSAVLVTVLDARTGVAPTAQPTVTVFDGTSGDAARQLPGLNPPQFESVAERPGTFRVTVVAAGYKTSVTSGVPVSADNCGYTRPARITVRLEPNP